MLVDGKWMPTFPRARYLMGRVEFAHWRGQRERDDMAAVFADSVAPIHEAGLADLVETDHRICDEVSLVPTTGHTPGHVSVRISSEGEEALITGDFMHHPCQIARPDWSSTADSDPEAARRTRERMLKELCERPVLVIGTHFAGATAGHSCATARPTASRCDRALPQRVNFALRAALGRRLAHPLAPQPDDNADDRGGSDEGKQYPQFKRHSRSDRVRYFYLVAASYRHSRESRDNPGIAIGRLRWTPACAGVMVRSAAIAARQRGSMASATAALPASERW